MTWSASVADGNSTSSGYDSEVSKFGNRFCRFRLNRPTRKTENSFTHTELYALIRKPKQERSSWTYVLIIESLSVPRFSVSRRNCITKNVSKVFRTICWAPAKYLASSGFLFPIKHLHLFAVWILENSFLFIQFLFHFFQAARVKLKVAQRTGELCRWERETRVALQLQHRMSCIATAFTSTIGFFGFSFVRSMSESELCEAFSRLIRAESSRENLSHCTFACVVCFSSMEGKEEKKKKAKRGFIDSRRTWADEAHIDRNVEAGLRFTWLLYRYTHCGWQEAFLTERKKEMLVRL